MKTVDLHTHTVCSDGTFTPRELVEYACEKGLSAIAITDHDATEGIDEAAYYGNKLGIEVVPGIEVSAEYEGAEIHIVGLFIDSCDANMNRLLADMRLKRTERNKKIAKKLQDIGLNISYEDILKTAQGSVVTRAHIAKALIQRGYASSVKEAFERYIGAGRAAYIKREVSSWKQTIDMIRGAKGISVMAHPLLYKFSKERLESTAANMAQYGLKGIEAYYSTHSLSDTKYIKSIADKYKLRISGGSDFHGDNKPKLDLAVGYGDLAVPYEVLEGLKGSDING